MLRVHQFHMVMHFGVLLSLLFWLKWLRIIIFFWCCTNGRIIKYFWRRFIKPRFIVHFIEQPSYLKKNPVCKKITDVVDLPFSKLIPKAPAFFTALVPDSYVVINCNGICFLLVDVIQMHKTVKRRPVVRAAFFIKIDP